jgi:hypothetical protein
MILVNKTAKRKKGRTIEEKERRKKKETWVIG